MAPFQNTRSQGQPLVAPLPAPARRKAAGATSLGTLAKLPPELRLAIYREVNDAARHSQVYLACRKGRPHARTTNLWLVHGHPLSYISRSLVWDADENYPFDIIRQNRLPLLVQVDISSANPHHSLAAICAVVNAQPGLHNTN